MVEAVTGGGGGDGGGTTGEAAVPEGGVDLERSPHRLHTSCLQLAAQLPAAHNNNNICCKCDVEVNGYMCAPELPVTWRGV